MEKEDMDQSWTELYPEAEEIIPSDMLEAICTVEYNFYDPHGIG